MRYGENAMVKGELKCEGVTKAKEQYSYLIIASSQHRTFAFFYLRTTGESAKVHVALSEYHFKKQQMSII